MIRFMLDTNICIYIAKKKPIEVLSRFEGLTIGQVGMSSITHGELLYGAHKSQYPKKAMKAIEELTGLIPALPIPTEAGCYYGQIRCMLEKAGKPIGNNDLWIAAHAMALNVVLVTNNVREFHRIPHLKIENWVDTQLSSF
ncbi:MAG: type II toxin-antitoxin system VapC family toxin [Chlamydiales bacterium]